ncbi:Membrane-bound acyltransferase YfiQ, involved in biofilm formation [Priestia filamentosa]|nr:Membrane-bound acyltransferase YfiQ, involved in biofilm formation [Priestia filamentosa]
MLVHSRKKRQLVVIKRRSKLKVKKDSPYPIKKHYTFVLYRGNIFHYIRLRGVLMKRQHINEIFIIRAIACLSVVFLHSVNFGIEGYREVISSFEIFAYSALAMIFYFGTPTFVFISELLLAHSYKDRIPDNFIIKRVKLILVPYIIMGFLYSFMDIYNGGIELSLNTFLIESSKNVFLGDFHGYFVLIIFQFYFLHLFIRKIINKFSSKKVLLISLLINVAYLSFFKFVQPIDTPFFQYVWTRLYWIPFPGWIFYFFLGYYCGVDYFRVKHFVRKYKKAILIMPFVTLLAVFFFTYLDFFPRSSKRPDMIFYTCSVIFALFYITSLLSKVPNLLMIISKYSYGIYLTHMFFLYWLKPIYSLPIYIYIPILFILTTVLSIATVKLLNKFKVGQYIVGKIGVSSNNVRDKKIQKVS